MTTNRLRWIALLAALPVAGAAEPSTDPAVSSLAAGPLPLVLKDGRIARVGVYRIPFATGSAEPEATAARELGQLAASWATDCFLTAQAIGHVAPGPGRDGDTLAAHRLARARADRVQATLAGAGLPEQAIASVWDWQFFVPESRVTLWVFQLVPGEDCDGTPLSARRQVPSEKPVAAVDGRGTGDSRESSATPAVGTVAGEGSTGSGTSPTVVARTAAGPRGTSPATVAGAGAPTSAPGASSPERTAVAPVPSPAATAPAPDDPIRVGAAPAATGGGAQEEPTAAPGTSATAAVPTAAVEEAAPATAAAAEAAVTAETPTAPASPPAPHAPTDGTEAVFAVQFDVNSSFLPRGAGEELRRFVEGLGQGRWAIRLEGAVAADDVRNARTPEQARRYSEWLTSRRVGRVREWLERHAGERIAEVEEELVENDPSRRVVIRARRLP